MNAPVRQLELPVAVRDRCPRCGRVWRGVFDGTWLALAALAALPEGDFAAALACWVGRCAR